MRGNPVTRPTALAVSTLLGRALLVLVALVAGAQLFVGGCNTELPTTAPSPTATPATAAAPTEGAPGYASGEAGTSWSESGVTVTITNDEWGAGMCHILVADKHCRTLLIENGSTSTIYSRLAIFNGPEPGCGAYGPDGATGDPNMLSGPTSIPAGGAGSVSYCVDVTPDKCNRIQVDDSWGPFGVFVVGDVFNFTRACSLPAPTTPPTVPPGPTVTPGPTGGPTVTPGPTVGPTVTPGPTVGPTVTPGPTVGPTVAPGP